MTYKLYKGNSLEIISKWKHESIDSIISDIPYGINHADWDILHSNTNSALLGASPAQNKNQIFKTRGKPLNGWSSSDTNIGKEYRKWIKPHLKE